MAAPDRERPSAPGAREVTRDGEGTLGRAAHPYEQGPHAPLKQPRLERTEHTAGVAPPRADPLPEWVAVSGDDRSGQDVTVAVQVLGRRVHDEVGPELDGPREHGRRDRAVDGH